MCTRSPSALLTAALVTACVLPAAERYEAAEPQMGSVATITLYADTPQLARQAFAKAFARIAELDSILSDYKPQSELSLYCDQPRSADLAAVVRFAEELSAETDGAFDIRAGALTRLWREVRQRKRLPTAHEIRHALSLRKSLCDAGGLAKGYAADQALAVLRSLGIGRALVAMSGDIAVGDAPPGKPGWRVLVAGQVLILTNVGVSTSGDEFQGIDVDGVRYSHIIDPRTGQALRDVPPVSVIARTAMEADAVATAVSVGGLGVARRLRASRSVQIIVPAWREDGPTLPATQTQSH